MATEAENPANSLQLDSETQMLFEANRLASFKDWPYDNTNNCSAKKMAAAGFYSIGTSAEPDLVKCYVCLKELDGWEPEDKPMDEHERHTLKKRRKCDFMSLSKEEKQMTVEDFIQLFRSRMVNMAKVQLEERLKEFDDQSTELRDQLVKL